MNEIDEFLRANKPAVKDDPTFLLETRRRLEAVEGIKAEVDRQRSRGRLALVFALAIGFALFLSYLVSKRTLAKEIESEEKNLEK